MGEQVRWIEPQVLADVALYIEALRAVEDKIMDRLVANPTSAAANLGSIKVTNIDGEVVGWIEDIGEGCWYFTQTDPEGADQ